MLSKDYLSYQYLLHVLLSLSKTSLSFEVVQIEAFFSEGGSKIFKKRRLNTDFILDTVSNLNRQILGPLFTKCLASQEVAF